MNQPRCIGKVHYIQWCEIEMGKRKLSGIPTAKVGVYIIKCVGLYYARSSFNSGQHSWRPLFSN